MNTGKTLFAQLMDFLPWTTFTRIVDRYGGDHRVRTLSCAEQYRSMAFAQLTYRESLRDIETCLSVHASKLYHMGFRQPVRRSTLADANERRDWRIHAALAQRLITQARTLYVDEELGLDLTNTVYALDSTTIALCLSVFPWAHFRTTKAAVKMHTLLDLRGNIPSFIHISDGKLHDVHALDMLLPEAGAIYVVDRGYADFARLYVLHQAGAFFVTRAKSNIDAHRVYSAPTDRSTGIICDQTISLDGFYTRQDYPELLRRIRFKDPESGKTLVFITNNFSLPAATICALYKSRWQVELFFKWIKQHLRIKQFYGTSENAVKTQIWIAVSVYVLVAIVKKRLDLDASLYTLLQILSVTLFEKMPLHQALAGDENRCNASQITNQLNLFDFQPDTSDIESEIGPLGNPQRESGIPLGGISPLGAPEGAREQDQNREDLESTEEHARGQQPFGGVGQGREISTRPDDFAETGADVGERRGRARDQARHQDGENEPEDEEERHHRIGGRIRDRPPAITGDEDTVWLPYARS